MVLHSSQVEVASDLHRFRVLCNGRRWGKTTLAVEEIKGKLISKPCRIAYISTTFQQSRDIAWEIMKRELRPAVISINEARLEIKVKNVQGGESVVFLRGWESVETLRGQQFDFLVLDEVASMRNFWSGWNEVLSPTLTDTRGEALFISTPKGFNHFYDLYNLQDVDPDYKSWHFTTYDNPYIPVDEIEREKRTKPENAFAQEYLADFRKTEGLVYKEFSREIHIFDELPQIGFIETLGGVDFGFTHPAAVPTIKKDFDGGYWMTEEWVKTGQTDSQIAEYVAAKQFSKVYPDPENAGGIQELKNKGVNVREVIKGPGSVKSGVNIVRELLKTKRFHIHRSCLKTINGFETYSYPDKKPGAQYEDENPLKENDDEMDAIRYPLMMDAPSHLKRTAHQSMPSSIRQSSGLIPTARAHQSAPMNLNRARFTQ